MDSRTSSFSTHLPGLSRRPSGNVATVNMDSARLTELENELARVREREQITQQRLMHELQDERRRREELEHKMQATSPSIMSMLQVCRENRHDEQILSTDSDAAEAWQYVRAVCGLNDDQPVTKDVLAILLFLMRDTDVFTHLQLPAEDSKLIDYANRMHMLGDIDRDEVLDGREFELLWDWLKQTEARASHLSDGDEVGVLGENYGAKFVSPSDKFVFGSRSEWEGGLLKLLEHGELIRRSIEEECTTHGEELRDEYDYIVNQPAKSKTTEHGSYDTGHNGLTLHDFHKLALDRGAELSLIEVAILRMYTTIFFRPWNNALRGLDVSFKPDRGEGLKEWATCIAVLFSAVMKMSGVQVLDDRGQVVKRVWRGVDESKRELPTEFIKACEANQYFPGGVEQAFSSTTTDPFTAHNFSGGWWVPGTILEIEFGAGSRGADVSFLSWCV